jgi:hypothetical protein
MQGLEEQLLAELVRAERPELEECHDSLITSISAGPNPEQWHTSHPLC